MVDIITNFLDFEQILVNELFGDVWYFTFIALVVLIIISIKAKMPFQAQFMLLILWLLVVVSLTESMILWIVIGLFIGILFYYLASRIVGGK
jgi:putative copper export protein